MDIVVKSNLDEVVWEEVSALFEAVGWGKRGPKELESAFGKSSYVRTAYIGDKLIGCGRTVDDGRYYAMIVDLIVDPEYQGKGVGTRLLAELRDALAGMVFTTLTASAGKDGFYLGQGWRRQNSAFIWPRTRRQEELYAVPKEPPGQTDR